jgi:hypothetical protein
MEEKIKIYLQRPDRLNISVLIFGFLAYVLSRCVSVSEQTIISTMILILFFILFLFGYFISIYTVTIFLSLISFIYFFHGDINPKRLIFLILVLTINAISTFFYLKKINYLSETHVLDLNDLLKIFIFSNISPAIIAGIVFLPVGEVAHLIIMVLLLALIANFYFWHNFVQSRIF